MQSTAAGWMTLVLSQTILCSLAFAQAGASRLDSIVQQMETAQAQKPVASYQLIRKYRIFGSNSGKITSEVIAEVDFQPPSNKSYVIQQWTGSKHGENVVRHILDHEMQWQGQQSRSAAVTQQNYDFTYQGESLADGRPCFLLGLSPKRKEKNLISGTAWVDKYSFLIRRIEGELVKNPSWWVKKVHITLDFDNVRGTWLQTAMEAVADIRILGTQILKSELLDYRDNSMVAERMSKLSRIRRRR